MSDEELQIVVTSSKSNNRWRLPRWMRSLKMLLVLQVVVGLFVVVFMLPGRQNIALDNRQKMVIRLGDLATYMLDNQLDFRTGKSRRNPLYSWRADCLEIDRLGSSHYYSFNINIPPTGVHRQECLDEPFSGTSSPRTPNSVDSNCTAFAGVIGEDTMFGRNADAPFADKPAQTAFLIELIDSDIEWWEPRDITLDEAIQRIRNCPFPEGLGVGMANRTVRIVPPSTPVDEIRKLFNCNDGEPEIRWSMH